MEKEFYIRIKRMISKTETCKGCQYVVDNKWCELFSGYTDYGNKWRSSCLKNKECIKYFGKE